MDGEPGLDEGVDDEVLLEDRTDILSKQGKVLSVPIRFDFDSDLTKHIELDHPVSHLTIGQNENCRIPVCSPISPNAFMAFILRHFYFENFKEHFTDFTLDFVKAADTITVNERSIMHLYVN
jgi:hypothetical protein